MKVFLETYGCSANRNRSEILAGLIKRAGHKIVNESNAEIAIINTCTVKIPTRQRMLSRINKLYKKFGRKLVISGCLPDLSKKPRELFSEASFLGSHYIKEIPSVLKSIQEGKQSFNSTIVLFKQG